MSRQRLIALGVAACLAIAGALFLSTQRYSPRETHGTSLMPSLAAELNTVTSLRMLKGGPAPTVTIHKQGEQWSVAERADYPADTAKLRKLLFALSDAKIREEKTSNPAAYSIIGVEDPLKAGAAGTLLELAVRDGKHGVIIGKSVGNGNFVRRAGETTTYVVEPAIFVEVEPRFWIDTKLLDVAADKVQSIEAKPAAGPGYFLHRSAVDKDKSTAVAKPASTQTTAGPAAHADSEPPAGWVLDAVPAARQTADQPTLASAAALLSSLSIDDVSAVGLIDFSKPSIVTVTLTDGNPITLTGVVIGDKHWIQVSAPKNIPLSDRTSGRAFEIASYRYDSLFKPLEQLLMPKAASPSAASPGSKKSPAAKKTVQPTAVPKLPAAPKP